LCGWVPFQPADLTRRHSSPPPEVPREMALVREASRKGYFRQRSMCLPQHMFHMIQASPQQIRVRRRPHRPMECPSEMVGGKPRQGGQSIEPHLFMQNALQYSHRPGVSRLATTRHGLDFRLLSQETAQVDDSHPRCLFSRPPIGEISALLRQGRSRLFNYLRLAPELPLKRKRRK
jgi:hypothetical protein